MIKEAILEAIREKGLLLEKEIFDVIKDFDDVKLAKNFLEQLEINCKGKMITKKLLLGNVSFAKSLINNLEEEDKKEVEKVFLKLGISIEFVREREVIEKVENINNEPIQRMESFQVFYSNTVPDKKIEVSDFTQHFRSRFQEMQRILSSRIDLQKNLVSINKISSDRSSLSVIGIVKEKRVTKNKNIIISLEDLTGEIKALTKFSSEIFYKAEELQLDDIIGVKASGNRDILFVHEIIFPDVFLNEKTKFENDINIAFLSDLHCGSEAHLKKSFEKFIEWLNSGDEIAKKIKYMFFVSAVSRIFRRFKPEPIQHNIRVAI